MTSRALGRELAPGISAGSRIVLDLLKLVIVAGRSSSVSERKLLV
jgi:hypothetical protein